MKKSDFSKRMLIIIVFGLIAIFYVLLSSVFINSNSYLMGDKTIIEFAQSNLDLGKIREMESKKAEFMFKNIGENVLTIFEVETSCGCTNAEWTKGPIKKGESGKVIVVYDAKTVGRFSKSIEVFCNIEFSKIELRIEGEVIPN
jgi:hypothetical protein